MIDPLLALPANLRSRLRLALSSGGLEPPYTKAAIRSALGAGGGFDPAEVAAALSELDAHGVSGAAVALVLDVATRSAATASRPDLVWSGPSAPGIHTRRTRQVYEELIGIAERDIWISTYAYWDGQTAFKSLADRMDAFPELRVRLLLNIARRHGDGRCQNEIVADFSQKFWHRDWPGERRPDVYYDPRALDPEAKTGILHAKALVVDDAVAFVTSANLTAAAFDSNIEVGVLTHDALLATSLARHFRLLVERRMLEPIA